MKKRILLMALELLKLMGRESIEKGIFNIYHNKHLSESNRLIHTSFFKTDDTVSPVNYVVKTSFDLDCNGEKK